MAFEVYLVFYSVEKPSFCQRCQIVTSQLPQKVTDPL